MNHKFISRTHKDLRSTYWFRYVLHENPEEIQTRIQETFVLIDEKSIHLDILSPPNDEKPISTIVFIHGTSVYSRFYAEFAYLLMKAGFRVILPDMPGHGLSEGIRGHFTMKLYVQIVKGLVSWIKDQYGGDVGIMGASLGGITSLYAIAADPRIKVAVCNNAAVFNEQAYKNIVQVKGIFKLLMPFVPSLARLLPYLKISVLSYLPKESLSNNTIGNQLYDDLVKDPFLQEKYTLTSLKTQMVEPMIKPIEKILSPIMFINGDQDGLFTIPYMQKLFDRLTSSRKQLAIMKDCDHLIFQEHAKDALELVLPFFHAELMDTGKKD